MIRANLYSLMVLGAVIGGGPAAQAASIASTFNANSEGWITNGGANMVWASGGGNPGGHLRVDDNGAALDFGVRAPASFHGDLSAYDGGTLTFDARLLQQGAMPIATFGTVTITNGGSQSASLDLAPGNASFVWTTYAANLVSTDWGVTPAVWQAILSDVQMIEITLEAYTSQDTVGFDNFIITSVPEPLSVALFAMGACAVVALGRRRSRAGCGEPKVCSAESSSHDCWKVGARRPSG